MKTYHLTSTAFTGYVSIVFGDNGLLQSTDMSTATLSEQQQRWFLHNIPSVEADLQRIIASSDTAKIMEVKQEVTFEDFYRRYGNKVGKKEAQRKWARMSKAEQIKAYNFIPKYLQGLTVAMMYPASYLNAERWND